MFFKTFFPQDTPQQKIMEAIQKDGFSPILISDSPHFIYKTHHHPETKLLVCLKGSMEVTVEKEQYDFEPGDKLIIPSNTPHSAVVGEKGCTYFWSEKIID
jgi:quercetin dioxygenase-like cupin family protein